MSDVKLRPGAVADAVSALFRAHGASEANAAIVSAHLVQSEQLHLPSHGLIRVRQYVKEILAGELLPDAVPTSTESAPTVRAIDGHLGFGQVAGMAATQAAQSVAEQFGTAFVTVRNVQHTGRLGAYTEPLARRGLLALAFAAGARRFHRVVPFGGRDGRMSTNPIAWAAPTSGDVISADFATSAVPEGRIRVLHGLGKPAPADAICDADGQPTVDTALFYGGPAGDPAPGGLLPLGGTQFGHKGYALAMLSEVAATLMAGDSPAATTGRGNNLAIVAIRADDDFPARTDAAVQYLKSSRPGPMGRDVLVPGEIERRDYSPDGPIAIATFVWEALLEELNSTGTALPADTLV